MLNIFEVDNMFNSFGVFLGFVLLVVVLIIYNVLIKSRNKVRGDYCALETCLRKRWNLIPLIANIIKKYSACEDKMLEKLMNSSNQDYNSFDINQKIDIDNKISKVVFKMMDIAENSSDISNDVEYTKIKKQFIDIENNIPEILKSYDILVKDYNSKISSFPNNLVAILFGFNEEKILIAPHN